MEEGIRCLDSYEEKGKNIHFVVHIGGRSWVLASCCDVEANKVMKINLHHMSQPLNTCPLYN